MNTGQGTGPGGKAAELMAAVRAVESGEKSAAEFYAAPEPAPARRPAAPGSGPGPAGGARPGSPAAGPVAVPDELREVLAAGGAPEALAVPVVLALGPQAAEELREDPWRLLAVPGVRPEQADAFAAALGAAEAGPGEPRRARALAGWLLEGAARAGHTVLPFESVAKGLARYGVPAPDEAVREAVDTGAVLVFQGEPESRDGAERHAGAAPAPSEPAAAAGEDAAEAVPLLLGLERWAVAEEALADGLQRLVGTFQAPGDEEAAAWSAAAEAAPSPSAAELIRAAAGHAVVTHTGAEAARAEPAALVAAAAAAGLRACLATHGENSRLRAATLLATARTGPGQEPDAGDEGAAEGEEGPAVVTVAGLLSGSEGPAREADGTFALDVLAVVDAPLLDTETAAALVESLPDGARLVLSGDPQILGAAGPGRVPADVAAAAIGPRVVSRTPDPGPLGELVSGIGVGELNRVETPGKELVIVPVREPAEAVHRTVQLVADSVPRTFGLRPEDVQVITPGHAGGGGTEVLNTALKERFNPGPGRFGGFDPGDRVICSPTPGRPVFATVTGADEEGLRLAGPNGPFPVARERVATTVRHAWAVTAHQAAGTRWPAVVVVLPGDAAGTLDRRWVYTAFGRAERHLSVVHGVEDALPRAVAERPGAERTTRLRALLRPRPAPTAGGGEAGGLG